MKQTIQPRFLLRFPDWLFALLALIATFVATMVYQPWGLLMVCIGVLAGFLTLTLAPFDSIHWIWRLIISVAAFNMPMIYQEAPLGVRVVIWLLFAVCIALLTAWTIWGAPKSNVLGLDVIMTLALIFVFGVFVTLTFNATYPILIWMAWVLAGPVGGFICHLSMLNSVRNPH